MQKRFSILTAYFFLLVPVTFAQKVHDSAWFENYYARIVDTREKGGQHWPDSLEIVKSRAENNNYPTAISRYYIEKAAWYLSRQHTDSAIRSFNTAIDISKKNNSLRQLGNAYTGLANLYQFQGNTLEAAKYYINAIAILKDQGRRRAVIGLYRNLNTILNRLQQKNAALKNMLATIQKGKSSEGDLVTLINKSTNEETGFSFIDQSLFKEVGANNIYVVLGDAKFLLRDFETMASYGSIRDIQRIPAGTISQIADFPRNGSILMELNGDPKVYIVKDSLLYHISNTDVLEHYGSWDAVYFTPSGSLKNFPKASQPVTMENVNTVFNLKQEFDNLSDSISVALQTNHRLSNELSKQVVKRNEILQKRKTLLWASAIGLFFLLFILLLLARSFRQKQKLNAQSIQTLKKEQELQRKAAVEKERTRIATDMHDDLGAGLSRIKFLSETIGIKRSQQQPIDEDILKIRNYSHEMIDKMGEIVWALNEKNDTLSDLLSYTRSYAMEYLSQNNINCTVNMDELNPGIIVSGEFRRNIFLAVKEALHNIVKYAKATTVAMTIRTNQGLAIEIQDNGTGFDSSKTRPLANGLENMKKRIGEIGGEFDIDSKQGTRVRFYAPVS